MTARPQASRGSGPVLLGSMGFTGRVPDEDGAWSSFGPSSMVLPELMLAIDPDGTTVTAAIVGDATGGSGAAAAARIRAIERRWSALAERARELTPSPTGIVARPVFAPLTVVEEQPDRDTFERLVGMFSGAVGRGRIDKVVLARRVGLRSPVELDVPNALRRLALSAPESTTYAFRRGNRTFIGATPERLIRTSGRSFRTVAVAGTIRRGADAAEDEALGRELLASEKDREEHAIVVSSIRELLTPVADTIEIAPKPDVMTLRFVQHLVTEISGTVPDGLGLLALGERLHPTPAVGGEPRDVALAMIDEHEGFDRGWYASPDRLARRRWRRRAVRRPPLRDRRPHQRDPLRRLRDRGRFRSRPRVGGVADQAAGRRCGARHPRGRGVSDARVLAAFATELVAAGVRDAVVCPGSRSTPLALALRAAPGLRVRVLLDERAAGFFALGMARTSGRPVVLLATSGTATAEFGPAVTEAQLSRVPLVVLTADRPIELRDRGAPQTIDQDHLYGRSAKWFTELPLFDGAAVTEAHVRSIAGRAVATAAAGPSGPVQVNVPFREPLLPDGPLTTGPARDGGDGDVDVTDAAAPVAPPAAPFSAAISGRAVLEEDVIDDLARLLGRTVRGLIVAGPDDDPDVPAALAALASATGFPILADPLSGLRTGPHDRSLVIARGDQLARPGGWIDAHQPDLVIRTGAMPTSKPILQLLERARPGLIVIDGDGGWRESALLPATFVHADPGATARSLATRLEAMIRRTTWTKAWVDAERTAGRTMDAWLKDLGEPFEGQPYPILADALPDGSVLWAGNSMPVRDLDGWLPSTPRAISVRANRGANGIDGVVSTALGSAAVAGGPVALVVGDVSFLHDLNALVAAKLHGLNATIVLVNNDGGGIFSFLPQAQPGAPVAGTGLPEHYEELFGTPHGIDVAPIVAALGGEHRLVTDRDLAPAVADSVARPGAQVLELRTERARNVLLHQGAAAAVARALAAGTGPR